MNTVLDRADAERLRQSPFTYAGVGLTKDAAGKPPPAFSGFTRRVWLPPGREFSAAGPDLLHWQVHRRAGVCVAASNELITPGVVARLSVGIGPLRIAAPVRVVYVIEEPDRCGFAYGTLPGHPESGEESFILQRTRRGVTFTVTAISHPGTWLSRLAGPIGHAVQHAITSRYLRAATIEEPPDR